MKLLVFQHIDCEDPGALRGFLNRDGVDWDMVALHKSEAIPKLDDYSALWVMGGPMDVWDIEDNPWLVPEKAAIRTWVRDLGRPYLGLCLGHQLLADALNGTCGPQAPPEIGICDVELTTAGLQDPLLAGFSKEQKALQWHSVRVAQEPEDAVVLASSPECRVQAMRVGANAWSMQYHLELEPDTVSNWAAVPAYHQALMNSIGQAGYEELEREAAANMDDFLANSELLYNNFMALAS